MRMCTETADHMQVICHYRRPPATILDRHTVCLENFSCLNNAEGWLAGKRVLQNETVDYSD